MSSTSLSLYKIGLIHTSSCLMPETFFRVKVQNTVPYNEVRLVDVLLSAFLRYQLVRLHTFFLNLWNGNIHDLIQSSRFLGTYSVYQIQQLKHRLCMLLYHATANHRSRCPAPANHRFIATQLPTIGLASRNTQVRQSHGFSLR